MCGPVCLEIVRSLGRLRVQGTINPESIGGFFHFGDHSVDRLILHSESFDPTFDPGGRVYHI